MTILQLLGKGGGAGGAWANPPAAPARRASASCTNTAVCASDSSLLLLLFPPPHPVPKTPCLTLANEDSLSKVCHANFFFLFSPHLHPPLPPPPPPLHLSFVSLFFPSFVVCLISPRSPTQIQQRPGAGQPHPDLPLQPCPPSPPAQPQLWGCK